MNLNELRKIAGLPLTEKKADYPVGFDKFIALANRSKDAKDFYNKAATIKGVPTATAEWFFAKYNPKNEWNMIKGIEAFMADIKNGIYNK